MTTKTSEQNEHSTVAGAACPSCGERGRMVKRMTLESLLRPDRQADICDGPYHVCITPECETVYFGNDDAVSFVKSDLSVRFGLKETAPPRPVCYCFDHSIEEINDEIHRTGRSTVLDSIKTAMKERGCRCEHTNPLGGCCLKSVQDAVEQGFKLIGCENTLARHGVHDREDCCPTESDAYGVDATRRRIGVIAASGSVLAAFFSSACCWLPLLLIAFGVSAAGVAGFFEAYRPYFITGSFILLGIGFYTVYFRRETCAPNSVCVSPNRKLRLFSRIMLWTATGVVGAFVFFPNYVGYLLAAPTPEIAIGQDVRLTTAKFRIEGMTCEGCAKTLRTALAKVPNVKSVEVDYPSNTAVVGYEAAPPASSDQIMAAVESAGYRASIISKSSPAP